jgi:hypothetical protein
LSGGCCGRTPTFRRAVWPIPDRSGTLRVARLPRNGIGFAVTSGARVGADSSLVTRMPLRPSRLGPMVMLGGWLVFVDVWVKVIARIGACPGAAKEPWSMVGECTPVVIVGDLLLVPAVRDGFPGLPLPDLLMRQLAALGVIAAVTIATILVFRARSRQSADLLALGCMWAGAVSVTSPILFGPGLGFAAVGFTELSVQGFAFGVGDAALAVGVLWLLFERMRA